MKKQILLVLFFSFTYLGLIAQCNQPFPPALTCSDAPILCDLEYGYCSFTGSANAVNQPSSFCGLIQNNQWIAFVAGSSNISIDIYVATCMGTGNGTGLQSQVYNGCGLPCDDVSNCLYEISPGSTETLTMNGLVVGNIYYLMIDGFSGDICDYSIEVTSGSTTPPMPDPAGAISGDATFCPGASSVTYCAATSFGAAFYEWTIPAGATIVGSENGECIIIDFGGVVGTTGVISATPTNGCESGAPSTLNVSQGPPITTPDVDYVICAGDIAIYGNTTYSIAGSFLNIDIANSQGCSIETIVNVEVIFGQNVTNLIEVICEGGISSTGETSTGVYTYNIASTGCDSTVILELTVLNPTSGILPVTDTINNVGDLVELQAIVNNSDLSIIYSWTGPCIDSPSNEPVIEVSCGGVYELQLSKTVGGVTCTSPVYSVMVVDNTTGDCPDDIVGFTTLGEFGNSKYYISNDDLQPVPAQTLVALFGGYLATISSQEENDFIQQNISEMVYIGLNDFEMEGELVWGNGEPVTYDNINPCSFCNENSDDQDFVIIAPWDGAWSFSNFYNSRKAIMEIPCGVTPSTDITMNCPSDINFVLSNGTTSFEIDYDYPTASTTCPGGDVTIVKTNGADTGESLSEGTYIISFEATDTCGNINSCSFTIIIDPEIMTGDCPDDIVGFTTLGEFGNSKYYLSENVSRPIDAQVEAESHGGYIVSIGLQEENDFIQQNISEMVYIGLNDFDVEGSLEWFNGESFVFDNINPCGICNENSEDQDFVIMAPWDGAWSFSNFYNSRKYVMEIPCSSTLTDPNIGNSFASQITNEIGKPTLQSLVPNPAMDFIFVKINTPQEADIEVMIYDARGVLVKMERTSLHRGVNSPRVDISDLARGFYSIYIPQAERKFATERFVKVGE